MHPPFPHVKEIVMAVTKGSAGTAAPARSRGAAATVARSVDTRNVKTSDRPGVPDTAGMSEDTLKAAAATDMEASGAFQEPEIKSRIDVDHPAVDNAPRQGQPADANRIDFNDPTKTGAEAVADNMKDQGGR